MPPPSSTDSGPVPPVFSPPAPDMVTASSVPAESLQPPPPPPAPPSLPFSNPPRPSVITSPSPCQSPASPVHQSQPRARIRSRTPPLSLRPSHFATSIIPQNTRRRLRLRRSLNNAPIATSHNRNNNSSTNNSNSNIEIDNALRNETVSNSPPPWSALRTPQPSPPPPPPPPQPPSLAPSASNMPNPAPDPFVHNPLPAQSLTHPPHAPAPASISNNATSCSVPLPPHPLSQFGPSRSGTVPYSSTQPSTSHNQNPSPNACVRPATANPSRVPRSTAIDELIAVLERNAPPLPTVRNVIARTHLPALNPNQPQHQESTSALPPSSTHCPSNSNYLSTSGVAAPSYSGSAIPSSHSQQFPDAPGLACIPSVEQPPQLASVNTSAHRQSDGSALNHSNFPQTSQPPHQTSQQHSEYHRSMNPFVPTSMINASNSGNDNNNRNGNNLNPHGGADRLRWHAPSDTTSPPSPPAPNSPLPLPAPSILDSARASSAQAGTSSGYGPPPGVPASLWPMPPLTRDNMLPRMTSGPVQRGISPYRSSLRNTHLSSRVSRPFSRDASTTSPITSTGPNNGQHTHHPSLPSFSAPSLRSYERQSAELDAALTAAQAAATASVGRLGGNTDDDATGERDRGRERERERGRERDRSRRISDIVMDDDVVLVGTSTNPMNAGPSRMGHTSSSVAGNNGGGSSGRRSVSFNVGAGSSSGAGSMSGVPFDILRDERRESDEDGGGVQPAPFSGGAPHPFVPSGSGWGPAHDIDNSYGEHLRRARMSRVLRMMGNTSRRAAQVSDDMRLIFGNDDEAVPSSGDAMNAIGFRSSSNNHPGSASATVRALTTATGNAGGQGTGFNGGGPAGTASGPGLGSYGGYGSGYGGAGEFRNADGVRSLMLSENDTDIMMNEFDAMEYLNSINLHPRHRDRERERDRDRDRDRDRGRDRSQVMRVAASRAGALRQMTRISRMPPMESMLRRCEVRAMVAGREFGVPCGLFEYSVRGRPSLTPTIDWPDVMLISDENVKPRAPILDLMAESHVNWCVRVGPLGNGEGDGRRGYQGFVNGLIEGGFAIELQITRGIIYLWALTFPPHGQCLLGVFRPDRPPCTSNNNGNAATGTSVPTSSPAPPTVSQNDNNRMATDATTPVAAAATAAIAATDTAAASTVATTAAATITTAVVHNTQSNVVAAPATPVSEPTGAVESAQVI